tara:strand:- start:164 stop:787 length:624 start_codon:yes stop_codon:yes gene_type:complete
MILNKENRYPLALLAIFIVAWIILAINPTYRDIWIAENLLSVALVIGLILTYKYFRFSNTSYTLLFLFLILHTIGAHYTYAEVPLFTILKNQYALTRNHYDRLIHFLFGLIFYLPIYEFMSRKLKLKGVWSHIMTFATIFALKAVYEVIEYYYAIIRESHLVETFFLGAQGDQWDAQKDISLGMIGAAISWIILYIKQRRSVANKVT